jgi:hypothetical protein
MSKTTKRTVLVLLLLCLGLGGAVLYRRGAGSSEGMKQTVARQPASAIDPQSDPAIAPPPAASQANDSVAPRAARRLAVAEKTANSDEPAPGLPEPPEEQPSAPTVALAEADADAEAAAAAEAAAPAAPVESGLTPEEAAVLRGKRGELAVAFRPKLGSAVAMFQIMKISAFVDGRKVAVIDDKAVWEGKPEIELWKGTLDAGEHVLTVEVAYHGNGHHVFSYFDKYHYDVRSSTQFRLDEGPRLQMMVDLIDKGGMNTSFEKRLLLTFAQR